jgi:hypothetical protein
MRPTSDLHHDASRWRLEAKALAVVLAVLLTGGLLGAGAYAVIAALSPSWPATVVKTANGWRVSSPSGLRQSAPALAGDYLAWDNGPCLQLLDLRSGRTSVLQRPGFGQDNGATPAPSISNRYVVWEQPEDTSHGVVFAFDLLHHHRFVVAHIFGGTAWAFVSGTRVVWQDVSTEGASLGEASAIWLKELPSGHSELVVSGADLALGGFVGDTIWWSQSTDPSTLHLGLKDIATGRLWHPSLGSSKGFQITGVTVAAHSIVWSTQSETGAPEAELTVLNLDTGRSRLVARAARLWGVAIVGPRIIWQEYSARTRRRVLLASPLAGGSVTKVFAGRETIDDLQAASGITLAWLPSDGSGAYVETSSIGQ